MSSTEARDAIRFDNSYAQLPAHFYQQIEPSEVSSPSLIVLNDQLAEHLGLSPSDLKSQHGLELLSGNAVATGSTPIAMAYAGHQFGHFVPQLGDGRAILLGELTAQDGVLYDVQLKGAGRTAWSRGGDGRNWIGPVLREYLVSEAMHALGIPTTRSLAAVRTGDTVLREAGPLPGAIITRVARSHIRVGTFQYFAARQDEQAIESLLNYVLKRSYPELADASNKAESFLEQLIARHCDLVAAWMSVGFIHGVMNTDNCSVTGDTIDYGPCAFMDTYRADRVFSSIDRQGRYAFNNQAGIAQWNLANLAQCLLPLIDAEPEAAVEKAQSLIDRFNDQFTERFCQRFGRKLGLADTDEKDLIIINDLLELMQKHALDFTDTFSQLTQWVSDKPAVADPAHSAALLFINNGPLSAWYERLEARWISGDIGKPLAAKLMRSNNPWVIPRNHRIEAVIAAAVEQDDDQPFHDLLDAVTRPFDEGLAGSEYTQAPAPDQIVTQTFCGT